MEKCSQLEKNKRAAHHLDSKGILNDVLIEENKLLPSSERHLEHLRTMKTAMKIFAKKQKVCVVPNSTYGK